MPNKRIQLWPTARLIDDVIMTMPYIAFIRAFYDLSWPFDRNINTIATDTSWGTAQAAFLILWFLSFIPAFTCELIRVKRGATHLYATIGAAWHALVLMYLLLFGYYQPDPDSLQAGLRGDAIIYGVITVASLLTLIFSFIVPLFDALTQSDRTCKRLLYLQTILLLFAYPVFHRGLAWFFRMYTETQLYLQQ